MKAIQCDCVYLYINVTSNKREGLPIIDVVCHFHSAYRKMFQVIT